MEPYRTVHRALHYIGPFPGHYLPLSRDLSFLPIFPLWAALVSLGGVPSHDADGPQAFGGADGENARCTGPDLEAPASEGPSSPCAHELGWHKHRRIGHHKGKIGST